MTTPIADHVPHLERPARVRLLPPWRVDEAPGEEEATEADGEDDATPADPRFADALADRIAALLDARSPDRLWLPESDRTPAHWAGPGDILILLRKRGDLMARMVAALHARQIPVAGVDRALLAEPIAVQDLLSLVRFVLQPGDDLALAELLASPFLGHDHEAIRLLRAGHATLWSALGATADPRWAPAHAFLLKALNMADQATPFAFLQAVLADGGRQQFYARLGREAEDGIDTLLAEALAYERTGPPTLQGFLRWVEQADTQVKRDPDGAAGRVRIMTVHGAKGLQAPVVVLADAMTSVRPSEKLVSVPVEGKSAALPLIFGNRARRPAKVETLWQDRVAAETAEVMRLLYVAVTRAETMLLVAGQAPNREPKDAKPTWHAMLAKALEGLGAQPLAVEGDHWQGMGLELADPPAPPVQDAAMHPQEAQAVPQWALAPAPVEPAGARSFTPSAPAPDDAPLPPPGPEQEAAARRGTLLHRLFERLPDVVPERRAGVARAAAIASGFSDAEATELVATALSVLDEPAFAALFGPQALAEAPLAGIVDGLTVAGTVDRLLVTDSDVLVVDFKTGRLVPASAEAVHASQLRQMAAYRAVLRAAFPGRTVRAALLFTAAPKLVYLPDKLLEHHWNPKAA